MSEIKDSLFIITGAGSGIGRALAIQAAAEGAKVIATDVKGLDETQNLCKGNIEKYLLDVSKPDEIEKFSGYILKTYPNERVILVNNAGVSLSSGTFAETPMEDFEWLININLWGVIRMTKAFLPHMLKQNQGHITNISSIFGIAGMPNNSAYSTAKFGVKGFSDVLKAEVIGTNVKISSVHPGGIKTNIARDGRISHNQNAEEAKAMIAKFEKVALKMEPAEAARIIINGIKNDKPRILVGGDAKLMDTVVRVFPNSYHKIFAKMFKL